MMSRSMSRLSIRCLFESSYPAILAGYLAGFVKQPLKPASIPPFWRDIWRDRRSVNLEFHRRITRYWVVGPEPVFSKSFKSVNRFR